MKKVVEKNLTSPWSLKQPLFIKKGDKRYKKALKQLKTQGFAYDETWALDSVIAQFILPRLKCFRKCNAGFPGGGDMTMEKWNEIVDKMIFAFHWSLHNEDDSYVGDFTDKQVNECWKKYDEGIQLFAKWFRHLWW